MRCANPCSMTFKHRTTRTAIAAAIPHQPAVSLSGAVTTEGTALPKVNLDTATKKPSRYIRLADLASTPGKPGLLPVSPATAWRWSREGKLPKPFKLGQSVTVWDRLAVEAFIANRFRDASSEPQ